MAQVNIEAVVDALDDEFKKALDDAMTRFAPNVEYSREELFKYFLKRVYDHCSRWETVPDASVRT